MEGQKTKSIQCIDCGEWFEIGINNKRACRCNECQHQKQLEYQRISMKKNRQDKM